MIEIYEGTKKTTIVRMAGTDWYAIYEKTGTERSRIIGTIRHENLIKSFNFDKDKTEKK